MGTIERRLAQANLTGLKPPHLSAQDLQDFEKGIQLFNEKKFWEAHEAWEEVWLRNKNDERIFFQGLIQCAAALHQLNRNIYHGTQKHIKNALWKLEPFLPVCNGIDVAQFVYDIKQVLEVTNQLGQEQLKNFNKKLIPEIIYKKPH